MAGNGPAAGLQLYVCASGDVGLGPLLDGLRRRGFSRTCSPTSLRLAGRSWIACGWRFWGLTGFWSFSVIRLHLVPSSRLAWRSGWGNRC